MLARVAHILPVLSVGGLWRHAQAALRLKALGFEAIFVTLFEGDSHQAIESLGSPVLQLQIGRDSYQNENASIQRLVETICEIGARLVHSYHCFSDYYAIPAAVRLSLPVVRGVYGITQGTWSAPWDRLSVRTDWGDEEKARELALDAKVNVTLAVSSELRDRLIGYGLRGDRVRVLYFGVDENAIEQSGRWIRSDPGDGSVVVGFLNRLEPVKSPMTLLMLARQLLALGLVPKFIVIGGGTLGRDLLAAIQDQGLTQYFSFLPAGTALWESVPPLDFLLISSASEGIPLVMLEAMARGIPVLATRVGGIPEVIKDCQSGYLVDYGNDGAMVAKLQQYSRAQLDRARVGAVGRELVLRDFTLDRHLRRLARIYCECLRQGPLPSLPD